MDKSTLITAIIIIPIVLLNIWAVIDISKHSYKQRRNKWLWTNIVLLLPFIGVVAYIFAGKIALGKDPSIKRIKH